MKTVNYIEIITKDFLPPVRALLPSFLFSAAIVLEVAMFCKFFNRKRLCTKICSKSRLTAWTFFLSYILVIIQTALLSWEPGSRATVSLLPFETWGYTMYDHAFFIENIIMFIPFGVLMPILFNRMRKIWNCLGIGLLSSCMIETAQFFTQRGYLQLDDVMTNSVGVLIGWLIWRAASLKILF